jgi:hypothetical protein
MEKELLEIFKKKYNQGDSYYCRVNNKGDKWIVGYKNDYPMQHGDGVEWTIPVEVVEMLVSRVNAEVIVKLADDEKKILDMLFASKTAEIQAHIIFDEPLEKRMGKVKLMGKLNEIHKKLSKFSE